MGRIISRIIKVVRYRFLVIAGIFPYLLGSSIAYHNTASFHLDYFTVGLAGILFALLAIEYLNEYFDAEVGTDQMFSLERRPVSPYYKFIGFGALLVAFLTALFLTSRRGYPIMGFSIIGALAIIFYVGPPVKLSYRGWGEITIALTYGLFMTMGSFYLQTQKIVLDVLQASSPVCLFLVAITLANEIPDYYQDKLAGKKNIVVRLGRHNTSRLFGAVLLATYALLCFELLTGLLPPLSWLIMLTLPLAFRSYRIAVKYHDQPAEFIPAIRGAIVLYLVAISALSLGYVFT